MINQAHHSPINKDRPPAGIYVHWPFCERKCPYCEFRTFGREHPFAKEEARYLEALLREIESAGGGSDPKISADTIYLGGGTPSLMGPEAIRSVIEQLRNVFAIAPGAEITLEINPTTAEAARLPEVLSRPLSRPLLPKVAQHSPESNIFSGRALGHSRQERPASLPAVNRLSVGCQSFNDDILQRLGRVHDAATTRRAIALMREAGAANLSLDIIFGAPGQTLEILDRDLDEMLAFAPEHISAYNMTVHEGTPFARWQREGRLGLPDDDTQAAMFERLMDRLAAAGYEHYEISNWSLPGRASRHNSKYWRDSDVYGFGLAAHAVTGGRRTANTRELKDYLEGRGLGEPLPPPAGERARRGEIMMLALRRTLGVAWDEIDRWMGTDAREYYAPELERLRADGLIEDIEGGLRLTRRGILISDTVMEAFF